MHFRQNLKAGDVIDFYDVRLSLWTPAEVLRVILPQGEPASVYVLNYTSMQEHVLRDNERSNNRDNYRAVTLLHVQFRSHL